MTVRSVVMILVNVSTVAIRGKINTTVILVSVNVIVIVVLVDVRENIVVDVVSFVFIVIANIDKIVPRF
ncbi:hypothetical protein COE15_15345 [Bacillus cereus]|uniref:Uncharacterized protein n=1 Tax=Bacillus arachidis TaxID=2819290 RepID=A0ABS3P1I3_9BACI|nr:MULTISPECIES: hypothetical protein [Bacillus]PGX99171.1 hypothetical protein COE15_15345 [Bacillus cereus]MBO1627068.1 hypothetical protein [Bacillus arachidis]PFE04964.1 hypothetical protein CN288_06265 [Bacillus sp. AFS023182]WIY59596.1 hypothetical protein QRY57_17305 [Bacillus arachidis]SDZ11802.1 hypothetical protein SAMN04488156_106116 [Bacillus sp. 166amftsu]